MIHAFAALFLLIAAAPLFAVQRNVVDEVIRMTRAGVAEETILDYIDKNDRRVVVTGDDVIAMTEARVPKSVIKAVVDASDVRRDDRNDRSDRDRSYVSPRVVVAPYFGYGYYNPYYYDPFWYGPRISLNFGFGRSYYGGYRGGYRGGHGRH
jgi:hypothetical protein